MIDTDIDGHTPEHSQKIPGLTVDLQEGLEDIEARLAASPYLAKYVLPDIQESREELLANERAFIDRVLGAIEAHDTGESPMVLLFDIDETLVKKIANEAGTDILRPGAAPLIKYLQKKYEERLQVGLLSSRGQEYVEALSLSEAFVGQDGKSFFDKEYVESSRDGSTLKGLKSSGKYSHYMYETEVVDQLAPYLTPEVKQIIDDNADRDNKYVGGTELSKRYRLGSIQDPKLSIVCEMARRRPDVTYILVDDFPIVEMLGDNGVYGVSLYEHGRFSLR